MPLKTVVKVGNISNLSDARYCAGMGTEMLGFSVIPGEPNYVSPGVFQEIRGWIAGPKIVAELYGMKSAEDLATVVESYQPDYFELGIQDFTRYSDLLSLPCIVAVDDLGIETAHPAVIYYVVNEMLLSSLSGKSLARPTLVRVSSAADASRVLTQYPVSGLVLDGTPELRPGYKDYSSLSDTLEMLDEY